MSINNDGIPAAVKARAAFINKTGSVHASTLSYPPSRGEMPSAAYNALSTEWQVGTYVVFSYHTPIAWARPGDELLTVPLVRYSSTTTQHQGHCLHGSYRDGAGEIGKWLVAGDPGSVRKGKGASPYGERAGW